MRITYDNLRISALITDSEDVNRFESIFTLRSERLCRDKIFVPTGFYIGENSVFISISRDEIHMCRIPYWVKENAEVYGRTMNIGIFDVTKLLKLLFNIKPYMAYISLYKGSEPLPRVVFGLKKGKWIFEYSYKTLNLEALTKNLFIQEAAERAKEAWEE